MTLFFKDKAFDGLLDVVPDAHQAPAQAPGIPQDSALSHTHEIPQDTKGLQYDILITAGGKQWSISQTNPAKMPYCTVGGWDTWDMWNRVPARNMDCFWAC
ncbi:hypothetical protein V8F20_007954 [Naviculisporaceae sp. PSN 640]